MDEQSLKNIKRNPASRIYKGVKLTKTQQKAEEHISLKCYSCGVEDVIRGWHATNINGEKFYTCAYCLECYTEAGTLDVMEVDWTKRVNLDLLKARECACCDRLFISADKRDLYCTSQCKENGPSEDLKNR